MIQEKALKAMRKIYRIAVYPDFVGNPWPKEGMNGRQPIRC